jgi:hypothetical protein
MFLGCNWHKLYLGGTPVASATRIRFLSVTIAISPGPAIIVLIMSANYVNNSPHHIEECLFSELQSLYKKVPTPQVATLLSGYVRQKSSAFPSSDQSLANSVPASEKNAAPIEGRENAATPPNASPNARKEWDRNATSLVFKMRGWTDEQIGDFYQSCLNGKIPLEDVKFFDTNGKSVDMLAHVAERSVDTDFPKLEDKDKKFFANIAYVRLAQRGPAQKGPFLAFNPRNAAEEKNKLLARLTSATTKVTFEVLEPDGMIIALDGQKPAPTGLRLFFHQLATALLASGGAGLVTQMAVLVTAIVTMATINVLAAVICIGVFLGCIAVGVLLEWLGSQI